MARVFKYRNGVQSLRQLTEVLLTDGDKISPRGHATREIRNAVIEIEDPTDSTMLGIGRGWNQKIAIAEFLQLVGGFSDPAVMTSVQPNFKKFLNGGSFHGAYGPRISMQMHPMLDRLSVDADTRQAVVTIWDPLRDGLEHQDDIPCTIGFTFAIRDDKLVMTTHMRSNDVWWGWSYDLFQFTQLQLTVANVLGLEAGPYTHFVNSLHLYERDRDAAFQLKLPEVPDVPRPMLTGIGSNGWGWHEVQHLAKDLFYNSNTDDDDTLTEAYLRETFHS